MTWTAIFAGLAILGQLVNVFIGLSLKAAMLENNQKLLDKVASDYVPRELHEAYHTALIARLENLEKGGRRHA